jgi:DNA-binding IclR family transcriptional regulator
VVNKPSGRLTLLSNHGHVLVCIANDPDVRLREVAERVGITNRSAFGIVDDLARGGVIERFKVGRSNRYRVNPDAPLGHAVVAGLKVSDLLGAVTNGAAVSDTAAVTV